MRRGNRRRGAAGHGHRLDLDGAAAATQAAVPRPEPFQPFAVGYVDLGPLRVVIVLAVGVEVAIELGGRTGLEQREVSPGWPPQVA